MKQPHALGRSLPLVIAIFVLLFGAGSLPTAWAEEDATTKAKASVDTAVEKVKEAAETTGDKIEELWHKIDEKRLRNRTRDEIVAWVLMGVLVGAVAGMFTQLSNTTSGWMVRVALGLVGAFVGGIVAHVMEIDFGLGPVLIRYEDLLFALIGASVLVVIGRLMRKSATKPEEKK